MISPESLQSRVTEPGVVRRHSVCCAKAMCLKTREVGKENSPVQFNNIEKEWMESSIINCVTKVIVLHKHAFF